MRSVLEIVAAVRNLQSCVTMLQAEVAELKQAKAVEPEKKLTQSERMKAYWANKKKG